VVGALAGWGDPRVVPALIYFLQNDDCAGQFGMDVRVPALKAQAALRRITGCLFPSDVRNSEKAWANARRFPSARQRAQSLRDALSDSTDPLQAIASQTRHQVWIKVTNRSRRTIFVTRRPFAIGFEWEEFRTEGGGTADVRGRGSFVRLSPGESVRWSESAPVYSSASSAKLRQVSLLYARHGHEFGVNAWMGLVRATVKRHGRHVARQSPRTEITHL
jgi:hypothetical protein